MTLAPAFDQAEPGFLAGSAGPLGRPPAPGKWVGARQSCEGRVSGVGPKTFTGAVCGGLGASGLPLLHLTLLARVDHETVPSWILSVRLTGARSNEVATMLDEAALKRIDPVDLHVGAMLRALRRAKGMGKSELGRGVGVSYQQVQKYELGHNRLSAGMLFRMSQALDVEIAEFFSGLERKEINQPSILSRFVVAPDAVKFMKAALALTGATRDQLFQLCIVLAEDK